MHKEAASTFARNQKFDVDDPNLKMGTEVMASGPKQQTFRGTGVFLDKISEVDEGLRKSTVTNSTKNKKIRYRPHGVKDENSHTPRAGEKPLGLDKNGYQWVSNAKDYEKIDANNRTQPIFKPHATYMGSTFQGADVMDAAREDDSTLS